MISGSTLNAMPAQGADSSSDDTLDEVNGAAAS